MSIENREFAFPRISEDHLEHTDANGLHAPTPPPAVPLASDEPAAIPMNGVNRHAEAGRKGAERIHQLIQAGKLYEKEHSLKPGRQRLRQLIAEGKLYEQEHGLNPGRGASGRRPAKLSNRQSLKLLLQLLVRVTKPAFREQVLQVLRDLENEPAELREGA